MNFKPNSNNLGIHSVIIVLEDANPNGSKKKTYSLIIEVVEDKHDEYTSNLAYFENRVKDRFVEGRIFNVYANSTAHVKFS